MNALGVREFSNQAPLNSNEEGAQQYNSLQQMPQTKRSFSAEGTVKRGSKFRTTMRNEFLNAGNQNKNGNNPEEDTQFKKTTKVVLKRYNSAFPKDFFGNVKKGGELLVQQNQKQNDQLVNNQGIIPTGYTYSIRQDSYQFLSQQQQQQNENQSLHNISSINNNSTQKLTRQQMQLLSQSQYLHQNMYIISQNSKQIPTQFQQYPQIPNFSQIQNLSSHLQQPHLTSHQPQKYRCQSEADSPIKKSAYDILEGNIRNHLVTQSEQKNSKQFNYPSQQYQQPQQPTVSHQNACQQQQQPDQNKSNPSSNTLINYSYNYINTNNYPSSQMSGENSPLKESKFNNQTANSTASSSIPFQWKHIFSNKSSSSSSSLQQQLLHQQEGNLGINSNIKNQLKKRQNAAPKPQFQHQNQAYCKTEQSEETSQNLTNQVRNTSSNQNNGQHQHQNNLNFIDLLRGSINHDTPKFISDESTTQSSQQHLPNSFTAAIIQQQLMQKLQSNAIKNDNRSSFSNQNNTQSEKKPHKKIGDEDEHPAPSYHIQIKQKRKAQPTRSHSEIKFQNSTISQNLGVTQNLTQVVNNKGQFQNKNNEQTVDNKNNPNYATFSSSMIKSESIMNVNEDKSKNPPRIIQSDSSKRRTSTSKKILEQLQQQKKQGGIKQASQEEKLHQDQSRQYFDLQYQVQNENQAIENNKKKINNIQQNGNELDHRQLLNKDYSCYQFNLQPLPNLPNQKICNEEIQNNRQDSDGDDKNGKENLINQINNIFHSQVITTNNQEYGKNSNYLNLIAAAQQQNSLANKISSNSSSSNSTQNASGSISKHFDKLNQNQRQIEETKGSQQSDRYSNEFIDDHLRELEKARKSSEAEDESSNLKSFSRRRSSVRNEDQIATQISLAHSSSKKSRIKVIYPNRLNAPLFAAQSSHLRTQSEANLSTKNIKSPIQPFPDKDNLKMQNSIEDSEDNYSPVHFHRMNTETDKDEKMKNTIDFPRKVFSVSNFQQLEPNIPEQEQKRRTRKPKSCHSQQVFNLNSSDTKKKLLNTNNQSQNTLNTLDNSQSTNQIQIQENPHHQNKTIKEKPYDSQHTQNITTSTVSTLPKIQSHQNSYLQTKTTSENRRIRFNSMQKAKTESSPTHQDNSDIFTQNNNNFNNKKIITQVNQKNNQLMKLSDFISLKDKQQNQYSSESESRKQGDQDTQAQQFPNQQAQINTSKINPFLQSNLNPNQFEFSFRNNNCQKDAENQISQQINKHKIQNEDQIIQKAQNTQSSNGDQASEKRNSSSYINSQMLYNLKLNINNQNNSNHSKDSSSIKLSSNQLKQPNKFFSDKKQMISQNLKTDFN